MIYLSALSPYWKKYGTYFDNLDEPIQHQRTNKNKSNITTHIKLMSFTKLSTIRTFATCHFIPKFVIRWVYHIVTYHQLNVKLSF